MPRPVCRVIRQVVLHSECTRTVVSIPHLEIEKTTQTQINEDPLKDPPAQRAGLSCLIGSPAFLVFGVKCDAER